MYNAMLNNKVFTYPGAIHIHSLFSDGSGDVYEISKAAQKAGLSWIIITDHNNFEIPEGVFNDVCVIKGEEISPKGFNHYLAFGIHSIINPSDNPQLYIDEVRRQGGFGIIAHPDEASSRKNKHKPIKWIDKSICGDGIEIWNWFSDWANNYDDSNIFKIAYSYLFRHKLITGPYAETLTWWDKLNNESAYIVPAIGGVDAHALKISKYILPVTVFPYESMFKTVSNILTLTSALPDEFEAKKEVILNAIKNGNNIIINRKFSNKNSFPSITIVNQHTSALCGQNIQKDNDTFLEVVLPFIGNIRVILNGVIIYKDKSANLRYRLEHPGKYRVEIFRDENPWTFSNPISVI